MRIDERIKSGMSTPAGVERAVKERYERAARQGQPSMRCPVSYDARYLEALPREVIDGDYGCGDPSRHLREGDAVLDLGSGAGKICFIASQIVGERGRVIGVDFNEEMLALSRRHIDTVADRIGYRNVEFRKGRIQDLKLDLDLVDRYLQEHPVGSSEDLALLREFEAQAREERPLIASDSVDVVVSNCVLNLVRPDQKRELFGEMFRVLKRGGRAAISDIVADEPIPDHLRDDPELWSGCISGAFLEEELLQAFADAGFHGMAIEDWVEEPFAVVEGIQFRSITLSAHKGKHGPCWERNQAVIYTGPWSRVVDDDNHELPRGQRVAVCEKTFDLFKSGPYRDSLLFIEAIPSIAPAEPVPFDCSRPTRRHPRETKGLEYRVTRVNQSCAPEGGCC